MNSGVSEQMPRRAGHPVFRFLASFPIACFTCALLTDMAYVQTANVLWVDFSSWLLAVGMAGGVLAALAGALGLLADRRRGMRQAVWPVAAGGGAVLVLAFVNNLVHSRDGWTSVMPTGLTLSAATVLALLVTSWLATRGDRQGGAMLRHAGARP